jgi:hypothetical protein
VGKTLLTDAYDEIGTIDPDKAREHALNLQGALRAATLLNAQYDAELTKMSAAGPSPRNGKQPSTSGIMPDPITPEQVRFIWNQVPIDYRRQGYPDPTSSEELVTALHNILCEHPHEAAIALGDETGNQEWEASIEQMETAAQHQCTATTIPGRSTLFKASEVPKFTSTKEYDDFRSSLLMFFQSTEKPAPSEFGTALLRILSTFEDPVAKQAAKGWNVSTLCHRSSWEITYRQFLQALDDKFQSATLLQDTKIEWMKCRPKENERPTDFFNRFEALTTQLLDVQERLGAPQISDTIVSERLLLILPRYLTDDARQNVARTGEMLELKTPKELRKYFEISWTYLPKPAATGHNTKANYHTGNTRSTPAHDMITPDVKPRACGLTVSYETSPPVPHAARGSLYPDPKNPANDAANLARHSYCLSQNLCQRCRRPRSQHSGHAIFQPVKPLRNNAVRQTPAIQATLIPEDHRLEAAPNNA